MSEDLLQQISGRFDMEEVVSKANNDPKIFRFYTQHLMKNSRWVVIKRINLICSQPLCKLTITSLIEELLFEFQLLPLKKVGKDG